MEGMDGAQEGVTALSDVRSVVFGAAHDSCFVLDVLRAPPHVCFACPLWLFLVRCIFAQVVISRHDRVVGALQPRCQ
jgi:hypothetical protein